jgi:NAD(P)-dependent dehydrogenase (short-subunit alcohol dehydrogenase family)
MNGKTILVTGATDGIGTQTALELARMGAKVIVHGRNPQRGESTVRDIRRQSGNDNITFEQADFASLAQVRALAARINERNDRLDVLINNAGVSMRKRELSEDGFEMTFAVNHLAHFLLTNLLLDLLKASAPSRVVIVSSQSHRGGRLDFDDLQSEKQFGGYDAYSDSKLFNVMFAVELAERLRGTSVTSNSLHPGVIATKLLHAGFPGMSGISLEEGAALSVYLASSDEVAGVTGKYYSNGRVASHASAADDPALRQRLWDISAKLCGLA